MMKTAQERLLFLNKFLQQPKEVGSVTPSSIHLARKMVRQTEWSETKFIAELGAGTGAITEQIRAASASDAKVLLFEKDALMRERLARRFPGYSCHEDAAMLRSALQRNGIERLDCILSGLPFFNFPQSLRDRLMDQIVSSLRPGGKFIAFQYSRQMRKQLSERFELERVHFVPLNFPPAFVYVCRKRGSARELRFAAGPPASSWLRYFFPVLRHVMPYAAGLNKMSYGRYALFSYTTGLVWTIAYFSLGRYVGDHARDVGYAIYTEGLRFLWLPAVLIAIFVILRRRRVT